jgi:hypothetical protein
VGLGHRQDVPQAPCCQVLAQRGIGAVHLVPGGPAGRDPGVQRPVDHRSGQRGLGGEGDVVRDAGAIGSSLESEEAIRKATYSIREQERQARNRDRDAVMVPR